MLRELVGPCIGQRRGEHTVDLGISQMHVSRTLEKTMRELREQL
mgnify:CR=1 FL=1